MIMVSIGSGTLVFKARIDKDSLFEAPVNGAPVCDFKKALPLFSGQLPGKFQHPFDHVHLLTFPTRILHTFLLIIHIDFVVLQVNPDLTRIPFFSVGYIRRVMALQAPRLELSN